MGRKRPPECQQEIAGKLEEALGHPLRAWILAQLNDSPAAASDLAKKSGEPRNRVNYHFRELERLDCIELIDTVKVRGNMEKKIYRGKTRMLLDDDIWRKLRKKTRTGISVKAVAESIERAQRALEAGTFDSRLDRVVANYKPMLDEEGWDEVVEILREAHERIEGVEPRALARTPDHMNRRRTTITLMAYESPPGT
jgi:hypothetical protein